VFKGYFKDYVNDIENIYMVKNEKVDIDRYVKMVSTNEIGFEGLHFYLFRMHHAFILIEILWKIMLTHDKEYEIFKYIFEVIINQLFEEYIFVKNSFKKLEEVFRNQDNEEWSVEFLYFYDHFIWKNKKFVEMYDKYNWFFKNNLIRYPSLFYMDEAEATALNDKLIQHREKVDKRKHFINNKQTYKQLSELSATYFRSIVGVDGSEDKEWLLFSRQSILNKLEVEMIQKRVSTSDKLYVSEYGYNESDQNIEEKETKQSLSERL